jgi:two-component system chemotaxis response regulator CheB
MDSGADGDRPADRLIVIGASAGGVEALSRLVAGLPEDFPAAIVVVLHRPAGFPSHLSEILKRAGRLRAMEAWDGGPLKAGYILVAPSGYHLVVQDGRVKLLDTPRVNGVKPAIDPLFHSAAREYGPRAVAVVLTGTLRDGSEGLAAVRKAGGVAVVQDPEDAAYPDMPQSALDVAGADYCIPLKDMASLLGRVCPVT